MSPLHTLRMASRPSLVTRPLPIYPLLEALEPRIAPATFTFTDVDGDLVTIKTSQGSDAELVAILTFENAGLGKQLQTIDFSANAAVFSGTSLTITAKPSLSLGGDGLVNVGLIDASAAFNGGNNLNLGKIVIHGDLGRILAGTDANSVSATSLNLQSVGIYGTSTQEGAGSYQSSLLGSLGSLIVKGDFEGVDFWVKGNAGIQTVSIGGSVVGTDAGSYAGSVYASSAIGKVTVGGSLIGGAGDFTGTVTSGSGRIGSVAIGGSVLGGGGENSGSIQAETIGNVTIGRDLRGGSGDSSGTILLQAESLGKVSVGGSIIGGAGDQSGSISVELGKIAGVSVGGDLAGGEGENSASITAQQSGGISIKGSMFGGEGKLSSSVDIDGPVASFSLGGGMFGGSGTNSATLQGTDFGKIAIGGPLLGGESGLGSARILIDSASALTVGGDVLGGFVSSGQIESTGAVGKVTIAGSLIGGGLNSGQISLQSAGAIQLAGDVIGGSGENSGKLTSGASTLVVGGSIFGGSDSNAGSLYSKGGKISVGSLVGDLGLNSGVLLAIGQTGSVEIRGSILGGAGAASGFLGLFSGSSGTVNIGGSVLSGAGGGSGFVLANDTIKTLVIQGNLINNHSGISASSLLDTKAVDSLTIKGNIRGSLVADAIDVKIGGNVGKMQLDGSLLAGVAQSGRVQITGNVGTLAVGGSLISHASINNSFSAEITAGKIQALSIGGSLIGDSAASSSIFAESYGKLQIGGSLITHSFGAIITNSAIGAGIGSAQIGGSIHGGSLESEAGAGSITVKGDVQGRSGGLGRVAIFAGSVQSISIGGSLLGGDQVGSGYLTADENVGAISIAGSVIGARNSVSGLISLGAGEVGTITIGQSLISGTKGFYTGTIYSDGHIGTLLIGGDLRGGVATGADSLSYGGSILAGSIGKLSIVGSIFGATNDTTGFFDSNSHIRVTNDLGALSVGGSIHGNADVPVMITARGQSFVPPASTADVAIGAITVNGSVSHTNILAGYNRTGSGINGNGGVNADAQIGKIQIGGDSASSNFVAGVATGADGIFGTNDDVVLAGGDPGIYSRIAEILVGGQARASVDPSVQFGWVAQWLPTVKVGTNVLPLLQGPGNDLIPRNVSSNFDGNARELPI